MISREIQKTVTDKSNVKVNRWLAEKSKPAFHHCHENHHQYHLHHHACHHFHHRHHHHYVCHSADIIRQCPEMILVYSAFDGFSSFSVTGLSHSGVPDQMDPFPILAWSAHHHNVRDLEAPASHTYIVVPQIWKAELRNVKSFTRRKHLFVPHVST